MLSLSLCLHAGLMAQAPFPVGLDGELYFCPRIDLVPAGDGGPYTVTLDGILDEPVWKRAAFHTVNTNLLNTGEKPIDQVPPENDWQMVYAVAADENTLYMAWKITDDSLVVGESSFCDVWRDDSFEIYIDAKNDGPSCGAAADSCYQPDDAQLTIGADQIPKGTAEELEFGGVAGKGSCDFSAAAPELMTGKVEDLQQGDLGNGFGDGKTGWQGEIAIALTTLGNSDDGTPAWEIDPAHGTCLGWAVQGNDDDYEVDSDGDELPDTNDAALSRDHKFTWAKREVDESAWRNPGVFGKLSFLDPTRAASTGACALPVERLGCSRQPDGTVRVTWRNPGTADPAIQTQIFVDDVQVATVAWDAVVAILTAEMVPLDGADHTIAVKNNSDEAPPVCIIAQAPFAECGGIRSWNILGALDQPGGAAPPVEEIRRDYLTDGITGELDFVFQPGAQIQPDFAGAAASTGLKSGAALGGPARNPGGVPTVFEWKDVDGRCFFREMFRADIDNTMAYAQCYVRNTTGSPIDVYLGISSDDSVQVYLNGEEIWINSLGRGGSGPCQPQDTTTVDPITFEARPPQTLEPGDNSLLLKVFDGTAEWEFAVRFQDDLGNPITEGIDISLTPGAREDCAVAGDEDGDGKADCDDPDCASAPGCRREDCATAGDEDLDGKADCADSDCAALPACQAPRFHRGDSNNDGNHNISDPVNTLNVLFLGSGSIPCQDAADSNDDGQVNISDPVNSLNVLFLGTGNVPPPLPPEAGEPCGPDPTAEGLDLGCGSYNC
jgi:hypothetical protein